jgi:RNA polymerase sigma factor (sigma-70 family)
MNATLAFATIGPPYRRHARALPGFRTMTGETAGLSPTLLARHLQAVAERRDRTAFIALFDYYAPRVKAYLKRLGATDSQAEDLAQEAMLAVWRKADKYDPAKATVATWVFTIARNLRIDAIRREQRPELDPDDPALAPTATPAPDSFLDTARQQERVRAALTELPKEQARVVALAFYDDKSHGEIAATLGIPLGTVKSRLRLAFHHVRRSLGEAQ